MPHSRLAHCLIGSCVLVLWAVAAEAQVDPPPVLNVAAPLNDTVARPFVRVIATCIDNDPRGCADLTVRTVDPYCTSPRTASIAGSYLDVYLQTSSDIEIVATDRASQTTTVRRRLVVEATPSLLARTRSCRFPAASRRCRRCPSASCRRTASSIST